MYKEMYGKKLKKAREEAGYTQKQVEDLTGIKQSTISKYEKGTPKPDIETIAILIDFYEISADWVLGTGKTKK